MSAFDETFDFVVVGSGAGSMCAALIMRTAGKSAVILEKTSLIGGSTCRSGGVMWIPNNPFMKAAGVPDSPEQAATYLDTLLGDEKPDVPGASRARRRQFLEQAPRMVQFLQSQGIKLTRISHWPDYYDNLPGGSQRGRTVIAKQFDLNELGPWKPRLRPTTIVAPKPAHTATLEEMMSLQHMKHSWAVKFTAVRVVLRGIIANITGKHLTAGGAALQGRMLQACLREEVDVRTDAAVSEIIIEDGAVKGVVTVKDGKPWRIGARLGVLMDAGGFTHNQRMRDQYAPGTSVKWTIASPGDTGEMIEEMIRVGAAVAQMEERVGFQSSISPGSEDSDMKPGMQSVTAKPHAILVDQSGVRYMTEGGSYMAYCSGMLERNKTVPAVPSYGIMDAQYMANYMIAGKMPGADIPQIWLESGWMKKSDTIEGLAQQLNVDPSTLKSTVDRWNGFCAKNLDEDFHRGEKAYDVWLGDPYRKESASLGPISVAPYYAVPIIPGDVSTFGGVVCDEYARVLRADGSVIPGLYACGACSASVMGRAYAGAGSSIGPSYTWGFVAARHAAKVAA
ncbi:MAG TPA: FAD-binding protein [Steroidobacteraceae bacterium]|jgi:3-oxosteroid 1-dehydrogenase|nr:FAD-binding protein [Steroidobacteraceae bacterium]